MPQFYDSYLQQINKDAIKETCKKCPDYKEFCDLSLEHPITRFCECDYLQRIY
jgi:hypothetical protein